MICLHGASMCQNALFAHSATFELQPYLLIYHCIVRSQTTAGLFANTNEMDLSELTDEKHEFIDE